MGTEQTSSDPDTSATIVVGVVGAIVVFAIIVALQALFYRTETRETVSKVYSVVPEQYSRLRAEQLETLNSYRWIDKKNGVVGIPIDRAMELVVQEAQARESAVRKASEDKP
jgi:hypothetical protein